MTATTAGPSVRRVGIADEGEQLAARGLGQTLGDYARGDVRGLLDIAVPRIASHHDQGESRG